MNSNNDVLNKSGIEYLAITMNNMLGFTNNNIKNININKTNPVTIYYNYFEYLLIGALLSNGSTVTIILVTVYLNVVYSIVG